MEDAAIKTLISETLAAALKPITEQLAPIVQNQKVLADTIAADTAAKADAAKAAEAAKVEAAKSGKQPEAKPLTEAEIDARVQAKLDAAFKAQQATAQTSAQRDAFLATKLKDIPKAYQSQIGTDPAKWATEEQAIRDQVKADDAARGVVIKDVSGGNPGGGAGGDGSKTPVAAFKAAGLSDGAAEFASQITIPTK